MIKEEYIKPIPQRILKLIKRRDKERYKVPFGFVRFYSYLATYHKELVKVTVAVKHKYNKWYYKQVIVHGVHSNICLVKDMNYYTMGGYVVGWYEQGLTSYPKFYETKNWCDYDDKYFNVESEIVNVDYIKTKKEYKYSALDKMYNSSTMKYLRLYEKYPEAEYLVKLNLPYYATSVQILRLLHKDKKFRTYIIKHANEINCYGYYIQTIITAYKQNKPLEEVQRYLSDKKSFDEGHYYDATKEIIKENEYKKFFEYIRKQMTSFSSYNDYIVACTNLNIDLSKDKNRYPHDFRHWHDIRTNQYKDAIIEADRKAKQEFNKRFKAVSNKYKKLEKEGNTGYVSLIAKQPKDLVNEGEKLHHCVGSMGYDQKFANEESLIFFIRTKDQPTIPLVTLEYSPTKRKVLQCYADHDTKPNSEILNFVNKIWLPYANRKIRSMAI